MTENSDSLVQILRILSIVCFSLAGVSFAFAIFWFIKKNVIRVINDLSGRTAKRSIEQRRKENEQSGAKSFSPTPVAKDRGQITNKMEEQAQPTDKIDISVPPAPPFGNPNEKTEKIDTSSPAVMGVGNATEVINPPFTAPPTTPISPQAPQPVQAQRPPQAPQPIQAQRPPQAPQPTQAQRPPQAPQPTQAQRPPQAPQPVQAQRPPQTTQPESANQTEFLSVETDVLDAGTTVLSNAPQEAKPVIKEEIKTVQSIVLIHTNETI